MTRFTFSSARRAILAGVATLALAGGTIAATAPAEAFGGHGGGFGGGAAFHPSMGGIGRGFGGFNRGGIGGGALRNGVGVARGGLRRGGRVGIGLAGLGLGLAAGGLYGAAVGDGYAYNDGYDDGGYGGCVRTVLTADGYRTVDVCD